MMSKSPVVVSKSKFSSTCLIHSQATYLFTKQSPVDQLRELLIRSNGPDSPEISSYFRTHQVSIKHTDITNKVNLGSQMIRAFENDALKLEYLRDVKYSTRT